MHGIGLDDDVRRWFPFRVPKPTVARTHIERALARADWRRFSRVPAAAAPATALRPAAAAAGARRPPAVPRASGRGRGEPWCTTRPSATTISRSACSARFSSCSTLTTPTPSRTCSRTISTQSAWCGGSRWLSGSSISSTPRLHRQRARQQHALALAAGERSRSDDRASPSTGCGASPPRPRQRRPARRRQPVAVRQAAEHDDLDAPSGRARRPRPGRARRASGPAHARGQSRSSRCCSRTAAVDRLQPGQAAQQGRLAGAVRTDDRRPAAGIDGRAAPGPGSGPGRSRPIASRRPAIGPFIASAAPRGRASATAGSCRRAPR